MALHRLLPIPRALYFRNEELTCVDFYHCDFDGSNTLVLIMYGDVIIFAGCPGQLMMCC